MRDRSAGREGSLEAPTRHPIDWRSEEFYDEPALDAELERIFDICHGCRRCFSLCNAFPTLFDAVDATDSGEVAAVPKTVRWQVVDNCYLCDMCYMSKCPYVPPHPWNVDFPHLMLRAKTLRFRNGEAKRRDRILSSTDAIGRIAGIPVIAQAVDAVNRSRTGRRLLESALGVHRDAPLPSYRTRSYRRLHARHATPPLEVRPTAETRGRAVLFTTCYGNRNEPGLAEDLVAVFEHNGIPVRLTASERCCGMPKLELGDLESVERLMEQNVPQLVRLVDEGWDVVAPIPSCVLMFKRELPLMFADRQDVSRISQATFDPFEYLALRHRAGLLRTDFQRSLGKVAYHVACHLRVQNIGLKTRDVLKLVPDTEIQPIERCSGHDGTYAVKKEYHEISMKIGRPVASRVEQAAADHYTSDCPLAGRQIEHGLKAGRPPEHPLRLLRLAYGI